MAGLLAVVVLPGAIVLSRYAERFELLHAGIAVPVAAALGLLALVFARRARRRIEVTLGRVGGRRATRVGRALGLLALYLALTGALALGFFALLTLFSE